jgi:hypothetical protein
MNGRMHENETILLKDRIERVVNGLMLPPPEPGSFSL